MSDRLVRSGLVVGLGLLVVALQSPSEAARPNRFATHDAYGYSAADQSVARCAFDFVDISASGTTLWFTATGGDPAQDEGGALIALEQPFEYYGGLVDSLVASTNGYVGVAESLGVEDGGDFSNDAALPAIPGNVVGTPARMMVYHDDLSGFQTGGQAYVDYFAICPRPSRSLGSEPCTIVQWSDWSDSSGADPFDMQALLYHDSLSIVFQLRPGTDPLTGGTIGIQNGDASSASRYVSAENGVTADTAVCWFEPRFPAAGPVADLELTHTDKVDSLVRGEGVLYSIAVVNHGPSPVAQATVQDLIPTTLDDCVWFCAASADSTCTAEGNGDIDDVVTLASGGWVDYSLICRATTEQTATQIVSQATVQIGGGVTDPVPSNDGATDVDQLLDAPAHCSAAMVSSVLAALGDPSRLPSRLDGVVGPDGDPLRVTVQRVFSVTAEAATAGDGFTGRCEPSGLGFTRLRRYRSPTHEPIFQIKFTVEDGRGGVCRSVTAIRGASDRSAIDVCAFP